GLRPGEKLFEELLIGESVTGTEHPKIMRAEEDFLPWNELEPMLSDLESACQRLDLETIRQLLIKAVVGFNPESLKDYLFWPSQNNASVTIAKSTSTGSVSVKAAVAKVTPLHKR
ncbi:MAG: polysaccharide biosynthesis protein, partial [Pseudohongiella sp.]|nr:polysaccharide biosynthesis protein [Pseudohongiella sp.]